MGLEFPQWVAALGSAGTHVRGIGEATQNRQDDSGQAHENDHSDRQRASTDPELSRLVSDIGTLQFAPPAITAPDPFETMSHQQIYDELHGRGSSGGIQAGNLEAAASGWRTLADNARQASEEYLTGVSNDIHQKWNGRAGQAAIDGTQAFAQSFHTLTDCFHLVAHGLKTIEAHLSQAKASVGKPENTTWSDESIAALPAQNFLKGTSYRVSEAQAQARWVMTTYYRPGAAEVDAKIPILPAPHNPVANAPGSPPDAAGPPPPARPTV